MNNEGLYIEGTKGKCKFQNAEILFPKPVSHPLNRIFVFLLFSGLNVRLAYSGNL